MSLNEIQKWVDKAKQENIRRDRRLEEYFRLVNAIDKLCANSESRLADAVGELIDKHYEL